MDYAGKIVLYHNRPQHHSKFKYIDRFAYKNLVNSSNCNSTTLKFSENKFDHPFLHVFIFGKVFPESHGFVAMPVTSCIKDTCSNPIKLVKRDEIVRPCERHSNETVTLR